MLYIHDYDNWWQFRYDSLRIMNLEEVRSSLARRLGIAMAGMVSTSRYVERIVEMLLARSENCAKRFYSISAEMKLLQKEYYDILERTHTKNYSI